MRPYWPLLLPLLIRSLPLLLPQTYFQPDEFHQSLEPAHWLVFGYGHLSWEWRDLPLSPSLALASGGTGATRDVLKAWYDRVVVAGRMRGWLWPSVFALVYKVLQLAHLEDWIAFAPRLVGALVAAGTDYGTYKLAIKLFGRGAGPAALLISLCSLFHGHALGRALSTSPETLLTVWALVLFPLPRPEVPSAVVDQGKREEGSMGAAQAQGKRGRVDEGEVMRVQGAQGLDYVVMDRMLPLVGEQEASARESLSGAAALAMLAVCIRPTTIPFWTYMGGEYLARTRRAGVAPATRAVLAALAVLSLSTLLDYHITGRLILPILTFAHYNLFNHLAAFYGATGITYHLVQSIPILTFPLLSPFLSGVRAALLPQSAPHISAPAGSRALTRGTAFGILVLSLSTHSEWRFLHPFLPVFICISLPPLFASYTPTIRGAYALRDSLRQYHRLGKWAFYGVLLAPIIPRVYLALHGRAQVRVMDTLRSGALGEVRGLVALMPCHSTPWMSHLHKDVPAWFLTCEPPLGVNKTAHVTQQDQFYADPAGFLARALPVQVEGESGMVVPPPSHVITFGHAHLLGEGYGVLHEELRVKRGYEVVWSGWNGFDWAQDERERTGGVHVWRRLGLGDEGRGVAK